MAELVDARRSGRRESNLVEVRVLSSALGKALLRRGFRRSGTATTTGRRPHTGPSTLRLSDRVPLAPAGVLHLVGSVAVQDVLDLVGGPVERIQAEAQGRRLSAQ